MTARSHTRARRAERRRQRLMAIRAKAVRKKHKRQRPAVPVEGVAVCEVNAQ